MILPTSVFEENLQVTCKEILYIERLQANLISKYFLYKKYFIKFPISNSNSRVLLLFHETKAKHK